MEDGWNHHDQYSKSSFVQLAPIVEAKEEENSIAKA
jgi:hypothetical protein